MIPQDEIYQVIVIISRYGWHGSAQLFAFLRESAEEKKRDYYIASVLWSIGKMLGGDNYPFPDYTEYLNPSQKDYRTADDIVSGLIDRLTA